MSESLWTDSLWVERLIAILLTSFLVFATGVRRQYGLKEDIDFMLNCMNCGISVLMGIIGAVLTEAVAPFFIEGLVSEKVVMVGAIVGSGLSFSGFEFIIDKASRFIDSWTMNKGKDRGNGKG